MTSRAKNLGLASVILGGAVAFSGCVPLAMAVAYDAVNTNENNKRKIQTDSEREQRENLRREQQKREMEFSQSPNVRKISQCGGISSAVLTNHMIFACASYNDLNKDGGIQLGEIFGIGNKFTTSQPIHVIDSGVGVRVEILDRGEKPTVFEYLLTTENGEILDRGKLGDIRTYEPGTLKPGNYRGIASSNKHGPFNFFEFTVTENIAKKE